MTFPILFFIRFSRLLLVSWQYYGMFTLYPIFFVLTIVRGKKAREFLFFVRKKEVCGSGFLGFSFLCAPHFELSPQTLLLQPTRPGTLTAHRRFHLVLLHSCPDTVHGVLLRKTQTSTSLIEGSFAMKEPSDWHHPRCSGLRVQGTAISPAAHCLVYGISEGMSRNL